MDGMRPGFDPNVASTWTVEEHAAYETGYREGESNDQADWDAALDEACDLPADVVVGPSAIAAYISRLQSTPVMKDEVAEWMRAHPGMALQLAIDTEVIRPMRSVMWCDHHGGHPVDADHLYEYGPETCHVHPMLWATGRRPICLRCRHEVFVHTGGRCHMADRLDDGAWDVCDCTDTVTEEDDLPFDLNHGFDYREWVDPPHAHTPPPPWVGL